MNNRKLLSILGASAVAGSILAGGIISVSAQEPTSTPGATTTAPTQRMGETARPEGMGGMKGEKAGMKGAGPQELAAFLGIDLETLKTAREEGKTLATVAQEAGKTRDQVEAFLVERAKAKLAEAVASGKLTQEQADQKAAELDTRIDQMLDKVHGAGGPRDHGQAPAQAPAQGMQ